MKPTRFLVFTALATLLRPDLAHVVVNLRNCRLVLDPVFAGFGVRGVRIVFRHDCVEVAGTRFGGDLVGNALDPLDRGAARRDRRSLGDGLDVIEPRRLPTVRIDSAFKNTHRSVDEVFLLAHRSDLIKSGDKTAAGRDHFPKAVDARLHPVGRLRLGAQGGNKGKRG